jgi:predicted dehydrogenase
MKTVRLGIIGIGSMGSHYARAVRDGHVPRLELAAVCDPSPASHQAFPGVKAFTGIADLLRAKCVDAVLVATPHPFHAGACIDAIAAGLHVLVEKPVAVHKAECDRMRAAYASRTNRDLRFASMLNQHASPRFQALKKLIDGGGLGEIRRATWIQTTWYRTDAYYHDSPWRATWKGEGGGLLMNQLTHTLDVMRWLFGMPEKVRAFCGFGKFHRIETEDDVTAWFSWANGMTGHLIATTGEAPGTNRFEIAGDLGRIVIDGEDGKISHTRNAESMTAFARTSPEPLEKPASSELEFPVSPAVDMHDAIMRNFTDAIIDGVPLITPAEEGMQTVELSNALLASALDEATVTLPIDAAAYERRLQKLIADAARTGTARGSRA